VQNTVKAEDPEAILARGGYVPGKEGVQALRVRVRDYEHRCGEFLREAIPWHGAGRWSESEGPRCHRAFAGNARWLKGRSARSPAR